MSAKTTFVVTILAFFCALPSGCRKKKPDKKFTIGSKYDATKPIVDKDYRFRLDWPGKGWKLGRESELQKIWPGAVAAASNPKQMLGIVWVDFDPDGTAEGRVRAVMQHTEMEEKKLVSIKKLRFQGNDAVQINFTGKNPAGQTTAACATVFKYGQHMYVLWAERVHDAPKGCKWAEVFFKSFKFLGGTVTDRRLRRKAPPKDDVGVGWLIRKGVFKSAVFGFSLKPMGDWRLVGDDHFLEIDETAETGLRSTDGLKDFVVIAQRVPAAETTTYARGALRLFAETHKVKCTNMTATATVSGSQVVFRLCKPDKAARRHYWHAVYCSGNRCFQFVLASHGQIAKFSRGLVESALDGFRNLTKDQARALVRELGTSRFPPSQVGAHFGLRRGVYRDFKRSMKWTMPKGFWRIRLGEDAGGKDSNDFLVAEEPRAGIQVAFSSEPSKGKTPTAYHHVAVDAYATYLKNVKKGRVELINLTTGKILVTKFNGIDKKNGMKAGWCVATTVKGKVAFDFRFTGFTSLMEKAVPTIAKALKGLAFGASKTVTEKGIEYIDRRFGFGIILPASWKTKRFKRSTYNTPSSTKVEWRKGKSLVIIIAKPVAIEGKDPEKLMDLTEQALKDGLPGELRKSVVTLAGVKARHLYSPDKTNRFYMLARDGIFYMLAAASSENVEFTGKVAEGFHFLP